MSDRTCTPTVSETCYADGSSSYVSREANGHCFWWYKTADGRRASDVATSLAAARSAMQAAREEAADDHETGTKA